MDLFKADRRFPWRARAGWSAALAGILLLLPISPAGATPAPRANAGTLATATNAAATYAQATTFDAQLIALINTARTAAKVPKLVEASGLTRLSVWWSTQLQSGATGYQLQHNPNAWTMVTTYGAANRRSWGENVAWSSSTATSAQQLFTAYMNSPGHRANILSAGYHFIGMGTVPGAHGLFNTTEFADAVQPGEAIVKTDFIRDSSNGLYYRLVGGAPVHVSSWTPFGGAKPYLSVSHAALLALPKYPADNTFIRTPGTGAVYRMAGGAPIFVSTWVAYGKPQPTVDVDPAAVAHAGESGSWDHIRMRPLDGTFIKTTGDGAVYRVAGGAPLWVGSWAQFGGVKPSVTVDYAAVARSGAGSYWSHLMLHPADNTYIQGLGSPRVYRVTGGRAIFLASWVLVGGIKPVVQIDPLNITKAGSNYFLRHLVP